MPDTLQTPPPEPDDPSPSAPEPYWRWQMWLPAVHRDSAGILADLARRLLSRLFRLRWRLHVDVRLQTVVHAPDEQTARSAVQAVLHHEDTVIALSRAEVEQVPPWRPLGTATRAEVYTGIIAVTMGRGAWRCVARMLTAFTVDVTDAAWPDRYFAVDVVPATGDPQLHETAADGLHIVRRVPTRRPR
ncbi:hypothetical protein WEI85_00710 [Actinomycetes bacterium KLBMP 9797]